MKRFFAFAGIDSATFYTLAGRGVSMLSGLITIAFIAHFLDHEEQGYYYMFSSLLALQLLFEFGMIVVAVHFASHEMAHLRWGDNGTLEGDELALRRLRSIAVLVLKWYAAVSLLLIVVALPLGWAIFSLSHGDDHVHWQLAWCWLVFSFACFVFLLPLLALLEACGRVVEVARLRLLQNTCGSLLAWLTFALHGGVAALPAMNTGIVLATLGWLLLTKRRFFHQLLSHADAHAAIPWKSEIWPFQWKIGVSTLSGYFTFHLFTPIAFYFCGAVEAGKLGMSMTVATALVTIAMAWMNTKMPRFGTLIAKKDYATLDQIFNFALSRSLSVMILLAITLCLADIALNLKGSPYADRLLPPVAFCILMATTVCNYVTYAQSTYMRAHKEDPLMTMSAISALLTPILTLLLVRSYGITGIMASFCTISVAVGLCYGSTVFVAKRRQWRSVVA